MPRLQTVDDDFSADVFSSLGMGDDDFKSDLTDDELAQTPADDDFDSKNNLRQADDSDEALAGLINREEPAPTPTAKQQTPTPTPTPTPAPQQQTPLANQKIPHTAIGFDAKGNVIDKRTNRILAASGGEARLYMDKQKLTQQVEALAPRVTELEGGITKAVEIARGYKAELERRDANLRELGLSVQEQHEAHTLYARSKTDPKGVVKEILTKAQIAGIDISDIIGNRNGGGFDPSVLARSISSEIDAKLKPVIDANQRQTQTEAQQKQLAEQREQTRRYVTEFLEANPQAALNWEAIKTVMSNPLNRGMSLREAWMQVQLDNQSFSQRPAAPAPTNPAPGATRPNGQTALNATTPRPKQPQMYAEPTDDYSAIANAVLDEAGIK